jgi:DNA-binding MarR family transcriptional regulator
MVLASYESLTQRDLIKLTSLPSRTVRFALSRLKEENMIQELFNHHDGRRSLYRLNTELRDENV